MPSLSVWSLRVALCYLGLGFTFGALLLAAHGVPLPSMFLRLRPLHIELLLIGWMVQLAFAVAYWILPRRPGLGRGNEQLAWAGLALLNIGVWTAGVSAVLDGPAAALVAGRTAELLSALTFAAHAWPRVRAYSPR